MNRDTADNRPDAAPSHTQSTEPEPDSDPTVPPRSADPLDDIEAELARLSEADPAESVAVLADITAELNRELDADQETS